jgi:hypothetical protein
MRKNEISDEINEIAIKEGGKIFLYLVKSYPNFNHNDLDIILNSFIYALTAFGQRSMITGTEEAFGQIIKETLIKNIRLNK